LYALLILLSQKSACYRLLAIIAVIDIGAIFVNGTRMHVGRRERGRVEMKKN
jgi:hypothetical protein